MAATIAAISRTTGCASRTVKAPVIPDIIPAIGLMAATNAMIVNIVFCVPLSRLLNQSQRPWSLPASVSMIGPSVFAMVSPKS